MTEQEKITLKLWGVTALYCLAATIALVFLPHAITYVSALICSAVFFFFVLPRLQSKWQVNDDVY